MNDSIVQDFAAMGLDQPTVELDRAFVFDSRSWQGALKPLVISRGLGSRVRDNAGRVQ